MYLPIYRKTTTPPMKRIHAMVKGAYRMIMGTLIIMEALIIMGLRIIMGALMIIEALIIIGAWMIMGAQGHNYLTIIRSKLLVLPRKNTG